jgi:NAD(P)-dependent dehydrogenase (short-subunit alcohol dehydrogenase family)
MASDWQDKVAVVTGGATGIGLALGKALAREGMDIVLASRNAAKLEEAAKIIRESGRRVIAVPCDVADRPQVYALATRANAAFGRVDVLCANAGATSAGRYLDHRDEDWDWAIDVNLRGMTHCVQAFYPAMAARGAGTILLTGSQTSLPPDWVRDHGPYVPAKAAVFALAMSLRAEAAAFGVAVSLLLPAATHTDIFASTRPVPNYNGPGILPNEGLPPPSADFPFFLSPDEVAERALDGLRRNAPIIATHAGMKPLVEDYFRRILTAYDEAARFDASPRS